MDQAEEGGVKTEATGGVAFSAVLFVADDGTTQGSKLDANLMTATGFEGEFDKRAVTTRLEDPVVGNGMAGESGGRTKENLKGIGFIQIGLKRAGGGGKATFDNGFILFFILIPATLEDFFGGGGFGEDHEAGGLAIEPVHNPDSFFGVGMGVADIIG